MLAEGEMIPCLPKLMDSSSLREKAKPEGRSVFMLIHVYVPKKDGDDLILRSLLMFPDVY